MRVLVILGLLVVIGLGLFFLFWEGEPEPKVATDPIQEQSQEVTADQGSTDKSLAGKSAETQPAQVKAAPEPVAEKPAAPMPAPIIVKKKNIKRSATSKQAGGAPMIDPSFDVVRIDQNCGVLVAGRAAPAAQITVYANEKILGKAYASGRGEWVFVSSDPLPAGAQKINAKAINPDKSETETARMVIMQVPDCNKATEKRAPALAVLAPKDGAPKSDIEKRVTQLLQIPAPKGNVSAAKELTVGSIDYDDTGNVALSGKGTPGNDVQVYLKNKPVGTAKVDNKGNWKLIPDKEIAPGTYDLRADQVGKGGEVISRIEIPFKREAAEDVILAKGGLEIRAVVQPGNSLWRIARRMYGEGTQYTLIYQANESQIKDPDLIYPGQIFTLPSKDKGSSN